MLSCEYCEILKNICFDEHLETAAPVKAVQKNIFSEFEFFVIKLLIEYYRICLFIAEFLTFSCTYKKLNAGQLDFNKLWHQAQQTFTHCLFGRVKSLLFNVWYSWQIPLKMKLIKKRYLTSDKMKLFNPFFPNAPFLYPLRTSEKCNVFWFFLGLEKECIGNKWFN